MFLSKIKEYYKNNKKAIFYALIFGFIIFSAGDTAFAACSDGDTACAKKESQDKIIEALDYFLAIVSTLLGTLTGLISLLLNPGWVNGHIFGFDIYLKEIWIMISNIVYFVFAFLLIAIAFMNIIGKGQNTWEMRQALPKFVIGVIMVPFSWFFVQFVLSLSAMLTVAVLGLPFETMQGKDAFTKISGKEICDTYVLDLGANGTKSSTSGAQGDGGSEEECTNNGGQMVPIKDVLSGKTVEGTAGAVYGIINIYTYQIMDVHEVRKLFKEQITAAEGVKTFASLTIKVIFDLLFIVVFLLLMVALFMALFARGTWLWLYAMFSPVFGLLFFFDKAKEGVGEHKFGVGEFIKLSLVPVYVSAALAFGLMFIFVVSNGLEDKKGDPKAIFGSHTIGKAVEGEDNTHPSLNVGGFTLVVKGEHGASKGPDSLGKDTEAMLEGLQGGLGKIILQLFGLAVLWIAVMAALKSSDITGKVIEPIAAFGKSVGSLIQKAPQFAPIIPTGKGGMSMTGLQQIGSSATQAASAYGRKSGDDFMKQNNMFGQSLDKVGKTEDLLVALKSHGGSIDNMDVLSKLKESINTHDTVNDIWANKKLVGAITQIAKDEKMGRVLKEDQEITSVNDLSKVLGGMEFNIEQSGTLKGYLPEGLFDGMDGDKNLVSTKLNDYLSNKNKSGNDMQKVEPPIVGGAVNAAQQNNIQTAINGMKNPVTGEYTIGTVNVSNTIINDSNRGEIVDGMKGLPGIKGEKDKDKIITKLEEMGIVNITNDKVKLADELVKSN